MIYSNIETSILLWAFLGAVHFWPTCLQFLKYKQVPKVISISLNFNIITVTDKGGPVFLLSLKKYTHFNSIALRKTKIVYNFSLSECSGVNWDLSVMPFVLFGEKR